MGAATARTEGRAKARKTGKQLSENDSSPKRRRTKPADVKGRQLETVSSSPVEKPEADPHDQAAALQKLTGGKVHVRFSPSMLDTNDDGSDQGNTFHAQIPDGDDEYPEHCNMFLVRGRGDLRRQFIKELRRIASLYSALADKVENPKKGPPLTYAVVKVPNGEIMGRGYDREDADQIAWIWNNGADYQRCAVLPDADLRTEQPYGIDIELRADKWPTFPVGVFVKGKITEIRQLPDPRLEFCRNFNEAQRPHNYDVHAWPLLTFADYNNPAAFLDGEEGGEA